MSVTDVASTVRSILTTGAQAKNLTDDDDLLASGLLDSVGVLGLVAGIERTFGLTIDTSNLTEQNFRTIRAITAMIERLLAAGEHS